MRGSWLRGGARLAVYLLVTLVAIVLQVAFLALRLPLARSFPRAYHRFCALILGLEVELRGEPSRERPTLYVSNHSSYLDIVVLGSVIEGSFVAKSEIESWPFFGFLAKLQRSIFIDRQRRNAGEHRNEMKARIEARDSLILFPEGTSSDGNRTLPFKTALFSVANLKVQTRSGPVPVTVQPVSVTFVALDGLPAGWSLRPLYAWYGDMPLFSHLWQAATLGHLTVIVEFHPPVTAEAFSSRKALAEHCWAMVASGVDAAVSGRLEHHLPSATHDRDTDEQDPDDDVEAAA